MASFFLTRRASIDLIEIEDFSLRKWGADQTGRYMGDLYKSFAQITNNPEIGRLRGDMSYLFYMAPAGMHFAVYKIINQGIIIVTVLHSRQNIGVNIRNLAMTLKFEIDEIEGRI